jgi:tetratricopeptide (TPR) repeat protein
MFDSGIHELAHRLDGLPLAIVLDGSFIRRTGMSYRKYLDHYNQTWRELQGAAPHRGYSNGNMLTVWKLSYNEIKKIFPLVARLLYLLSFFFQKDIWFELLQNGLRAPDPPQWFSLVVSTEIHFSQVIEVLLNLPMVQQQLGTGSYSLHPVVQDWCQHELPRIDLDLKETERTNSIIAAVATGYGVPSLSGKVFWILERRLLPHADGIRQLLNYELETFQNQGLLSVFHSLGRLFWSLGKLKEAEEMYKLALTGREKVLGSKSISTIDTIHSIGLLYRGQERLKEAENMYQQALIGCQEILGPDHISTIGTVHNLGNLYTDQAKWNEAESLYQKVLTGYKKVFSLNHASTLDIIISFGNLYWNKGEIMKAEEKFKHAYDGWEKIFGPDQPSTIRAISNLGSIDQNQGRLVEVEKMYQ